MPRVSKTKKQRGEKEATQNLENIIISNFSKKQKAFKSNPTKIPNSPSLPTTVATHIKKQNVASSN